MIYLHVVNLKNHEIRRKALTFEQKASFVTELLLERPKDSVKIFTLFMEILSAPTKQVSVIKTTSFDTQVSSSSAYQKDLVPTMRNFVV